MLVRSEAERRLWNELLLREHPQGEQIITGRQLRYLVRSAHGLLGALGVSASALHLEARDRWIGWDWELRSQYLERVICLSRFLIRPGLQCHNLASRVLGLFCRQVAVDMEQAYGCRPWLVESFVDTASHAGTSYRAANWQRVGHSKGRGRNDRENQASISAKDIYIYCLDPDFRKHLGLPHDAGAVVLKPGDGLDGDNWTEREFGGAPLGDKRLAKRLVAVAAVKAANPQEPFLECANGRSADMQGYYRFIEHPDEEALSMEAILRPHAERTVKRIRDQARVLCPQDSSDLDYSNLTDCSGLGQTGTNIRGAKAYGLRLHTTLALTTAALPLGILSGECQARKFRPKEPRKVRRFLPIEQKETYRWLKSVQVCERVADQVPGTRLVCLMDREGDIFEVFHHWQKSRRVDLLVRAAKDRCTDDPQAASLFDQVRRTPERCRVKITIPKRRDKSLRMLPPEVELFVRYAPVNLLVPKLCRLPDAKPIPVWMVHAQEENPPTNAVPVEWFLLSTEPVEDNEKACQCLREYTCRWRIEEWHKVLKSGCAVEEVAAETAEGLKRTIAINMVIAWRILLMTMLGRKSPELPPQVLFSDLEVRLLTAFAKSEKLEPPLTLQRAVVLTGKLGGYRDRKADPPPGVIVLWRGYAKLHAMCLGAALALGLDTS